MIVPPASLLPCPPSAGWDVVEQLVLPPSQGGGFSAGAYRSSHDELWLLSDVHTGRISRWRGLKAGGLAGLTPLPPWPLSGPASLDGEGLVLAGTALWIASEGRLDGAAGTSRPATLLRFDVGTGALRQVWPLPADWQLASGRGLRSNGGPESLTAVGGAGELWMAAEQPLQQDPAGMLRLLRWLPDQPPGRRPRELQPLAIPPGGWGLTDLLAVAAGQPGRGLLGLWRRFEAPTTWQARLVLYPWPSGRPDAVPLAPRQQWDLGRLGLPADNWEVLVAGPPLGDGRPSLLLASDDNFNPLQASHLARLAPRRTPACQGATPPARTP